MLVRVVDLVAVEVELVVVEVEDRGVDELAIGIRILFWPIFISPEKG